MRQQGSIAVDDVFGTEFPRPRPGPRTATPEREGHHPPPVQRPATPTNVLPGEGPRQPHWPGPVPRAPSGAAILRTTVASRPSHPSRDSNGYSSKCQPITGPMSSVR